MLKYLGPKASLTLAFVLLLGGCYMHLPLTANTPAPARDYAVEQTIENIAFTPAGWPQTLHADLHLPERRDKRPVVLAASRRSLNIPP